MLKNLKNLLAEKKELLNELKDVISQRTIELQKGDPVVQNYIGGIKEINMIIKQLEELISKSPEIEDTS